MATELSLVAGRDERQPRKASIGVLATPTTHTSMGSRSPSGAQVLGDGAMAWWWTVLAVGSYPFVC